MSTYNVGNGLLQIKLKVDISTLGLAATRAIMIDLNTNAPAVSIAHSSDASGDIGSKEIGLPNLILNKRIAIISRIHLLEIDGGDSLQTQSRNILAEYILDGGTNGRARFNESSKAVSADYSIVILYCEIDLI